MSVEAAEEDFDKRLEQLGIIHKEQLESFKKLSFTERQNELRAQLEEAIASCSRAKIAISAMIEEWVNDPSLFKKIEDYVDFLAEAKLTKETLESILEKMAISQEQE